MKKAMSMALGVIALTTVLFRADTSWAGCEIKITASNSHPVDAQWHDVILDMKDSTFPYGKVKIKWGTWKNMWNSDKKVPSASTRTFKYTADFGCGKKRRYHFYAKCYDSGKFVDIYYPSKNGWTERTNINLGDVYGKHCG